jgi:hypothetical protein
MAVDSFPSIGVVTTCHTYYQFLDRWCAGVRGLQTKPDQVVIAATDAVEVIKNVEGKLPEYKVVECDEPFTLGGYLNAAVAACETDWVCWIGVDDRYRPQALNGIRFMDADVVGLGMQWPDGRVWMPQQRSADEVLAVTENLFPCGSAFRRELWEILPFQPELGPFEDWALWVGFAALGAKFMASGRVDFDYSQHADQIQPPLEPTRGYIAEWARGLVR